MAYKFSIRQATPADIASYAALIPADLFLGGSEFLFRELTASAHATYWLAQKGEQLLAVARTYAPEFTEEKVLLVLDGVYLANRELLIEQGLDLSELLSGFLGRLIGEVRMAVFVDPDQDCATEITEVLKQLGFIETDFTPEILSSLHGPDYNLQREQQPAELSFVYVPEV